MLCFIYQQSGDYPGRPREDLRVAVLFRLRLRRCLVPLPVARICSLMSSHGGDDAAVVAQLQQCVAVFLQLGELIAAEREEARLQTYYRGRLDIAEAALSLDALQAASGRWSAGRVARVRRHDGSLDLALVVDLVRGVFEISGGEDDQEVHARVCWLRPRCRRELTSTGFLVPFIQLLSANTDWEDQERRTLDRVIHAWVLGVNGFFERTEIVSVLGDRMQCDDRRHGPRTVSVKPLTICPDCSTRTPSENILADENVVDIAVDDTVDEEAILAFRQIDKSARIASWETHTRGFGSRMLLKMGYRW